MKIFKKILKWFGYFLLGVIFILAGIYVYLAMQTGKPAKARAIFNQDARHFLVFAHRGGGGLYPENTLEASEYSANIGVDVLELDIHSTSDGALVVLHDRTVNRTTNGAGEINKLTLAEVKKLDAGYHFSTDGGATFPFRGKGITIPTLEEVFDALPAQTFNVEPKQAEPSVINPLCEIIRSRQKTDRVIVGSFRQTAMDEFRAACPEVATSATPSEVTKFLAMYKTGIAASYTPPMQALQIPQKLGSMQIVTKDFVEAAHRLNLQVHVWTINDAADMKNLIDAGVDGIMTDYPDRLLELVGRTPKD